MQRRQTTIACSISWHELRQRMRVTIDGDVSGSRGRAVAKLITICAAEVRRSNDESSDARTQVHGGQDRPMDGCCAADQPSSRMMDRKVKLMIGVCAGD